MRRILSAFVVSATGFLGQVGFCETPPGHDDPKVLPAPVTAANFTALKENSPFLRSVGLSKSLVLTGVAKIEDDTFVTLIDLESGESYIVSQKINPEGWQLVEVKGDETDLKSLTAQIKVAGSEIVFIRYEKVSAKSFSKSGRSSSNRSSTSKSTALSSNQLREAKHAAIHYREGYSADGYPDKPPADIVRKLSQMTSRQREGINRQMLELRNRGLGMKERRGIYVKTIDQTLQSRR